MLPSLLMCLISVPANEASAAIHGNAQDYGLLSLVVSSSAKSAPRTAMSLNVVMKNDYVMPIAVVDPHRWGWRGRMLYGEGKLESGGVRDSLPLGVSDLRPLAPRAQLKHSVSWDKVFQDVKEPLVVAVWYSYEPFVEHNGAFVPMAEVTSEEMYFLVQPGKVTRLTKREGKAPTVSGKRTD